MGTCGHSLIIRSTVYMYNLKVYTSNIYVVNYGDTVANHGSVYRPCLNYQKEEWVVHYSRPLNICVLVILFIYIHLLIINLFFILCYGSSLPFLLNFLEFMKCTSEQDVNIFSLKMFLPHWP